MPRFAELREHLWNLFRAEALGAKSEEEAA
jgi:hypothetical protein